MKTLASSLERIIYTHRKTDSGVKTATGKTFNRTIVFKNGSVKADALIYSYLRYYGKKRVTSRQVEEFKKRLRSKRKKFIFRLAGVDWTVDQSTVEPLVKST